MARKKKAAEPMPVTLDVEHKVKFIRLDLTEEVHRLVRKVAADEGVSMAAYAREAFEQLIRAEAERRGIKG